MKNKICVYAIAKNEEKHVERWYESMKEADLIIVLDTGSTDNTVQLLRSLGVTVHEKIYEHFCFDVARNDSLSFVPDEYNIRVCTDLDEWFEAGWAKVLREQWDEEKHSRGRYPYVHLHLNDGSEGSVFLQDKIHGKTGHWIYAVHECFYDENYTPERTIVFNSGIKLHHEPDFKKDRYFYFELLEKRIKENPLDSNAYYQLGLEYYNKQMYEKTIFVFEEALANKELFFEPIARASIYGYMGNSYEQIKNDLQAFRCYSLGICIDAEFRDNYYYLAKFFMLHGMRKAAIGIAEQGLETSVRKYHWAENAIGWTWGLYDILWRCYYEEKEYDKALSNIVLALSLEPQNPAFLEGYSLCLSAFREKRS